ncbi:MAG: hypothetical protein QNJ09_08690 [Paracoccaceae bacterium]|nr:hypothetical protein [Paracoccaceae bacterium]
MIRPALITLCVLAAPAASAGSLIGNWSCRATTDKETLQAAASFTAQGVMQMDLQISRYNRSGDEVRTAHLLYRAKYERRGDELHSTPVSAEVLKLTASGVDISSSPEAWFAKRMLMKDDPQPTRLIFPAQNRLTMIDSEGDQMDCTRR